MITAQSFSKVQGVDQVAFAGGRLVMSQGVVALMQEGGFCIRQLLQRHFLGDDGDVSELDHLANINGRNKLAPGRVFSSYITPHGKVWIITEHDRSYTTVMLPSEY